MAPKLGIIAGGGRLPLKLVEKCQAENRPFYLLGLKGQYNREQFGALNPPDVRIGAIGQAVNMLRKNGVQDIVMAGDVKRPNLASLRPDAKAMKVLAKTGAMALGDDGLLKTVIRYLEDEENFRIVSVDSVLGVEKISPGSLGKDSPDEISLRDIARGVEVLTITARADIGQAVVVEDEVVLAIEAVEGTANMLARCAGLKRNKRGGVLVKLRKTGQETRIDMPTIGPDTLHQVSAAGLNGIAIDAGGMIIIDRLETVRIADRLGLFIYAVDVDVDDC